VRLPLYAQYCSSLSSLTQRSINEVGGFSRWRSGRWFSEKLRNTWQRRPGVCQTRHRHFTAFGLVCAVVDTPTWTPGPVSRIRQCDPVAWASASHCDSLHVHDEPVVNNGPTQSAETLS
jgi:hypothetical protein